MTSKSIDDDGISLHRTPQGKQVDQALARDATPQAPAWIERGGVEYRRTGIALFLCGFASFSLIYCVQPLLPEFSRTFGIGAAESSLALSLTTGFLAISILLAGAFSQALGRRGLMFVSMASAAVLNLIAAAVPNWHGLLVVRAMEGFVLGGVPAVAMAYLSEEIAPQSLGRTMGLYVAGTAFGGMAGRVGMGLMTEFTSWRLAMGGLGLICLLSAVGFLILLPRSRHFVARPGLDIRFHLRAWRDNLRHTRLLRLYATGFFLTGIFVTQFNYATFRLSGAPYGLSQTAISLIFLSYALGMVASSVAGGLGDRFGRRPLLLVCFPVMLIGILLTLSTSLVAIIVGIALVTIGFFIGHAAASGSVGPAAKTSKGHAASLYLLFYYLGSSIVGSLGGWFWQHGGWNWIVGLCACLCLLGVGLSATTPQRRT